ncbi:MAG: hypothetical protein IJT84_03255 [Clostridia bacterium]|nr:hypothetical protein [Clostridia bacterium]
MPIPKKIEHKFEINPLACGQAVLCMLSGLDFDEIFAMVKTEKETTLKDMKNALKQLNIGIKNERKEANSISDLPEVSLLSLETPKCWHWSLYFKGKVYDPEFGILDNFPNCKRKYYWELFN